MSQDWSNQVAVITGGASGIGLGIADALSARGIPVTIADINAEALKTLAPGSIHKGIVRKVVEWGVFVSLPDANGAEGLVHMTEASHDRGARLSQLFKPGEQLEAERPETAAAGRILAIRAFGKANFLVLSDGRRTIQAYIRQDSMPEVDFAVYKRLDFGDWVGVEGRVFRTRTNELTIWASRLHFLAKCLLPLPEKFHGLTDVETRYRQRYLDLAVNPDSRRVFETRSRVVSAIRAFMTGRGYLEVETPMMQALAGGALARPFVTHHNALDMQLYLRIAPELYLKRLVVGGMDRVFEINRNFRNEGVDRSHNPEFTAMEAYEAFGDCWTMLELTESLIHEAAVEMAEFNLHGLAQLGGEALLVCGDGGGEARRDLAQHGFHARHALEQHGLQLLAFGEELLGELAQPFLRDLGGDALPGRRLEALEDVPEHLVELVEVALVLHQDRARQVVEVVDRIIGDVLLHRLHERQVLLDGDRHLGLAQLEEEVGEHLRVSPY